MKRAKRAVLLGTGAFPIILRLWFENLRKWQEEVDVIYVAIDHYGVPSTRDYIIKLAKQYPKVKLLEGVSGWPNSYADAFKQSKEDVFLIMHDDTYIYSSGIIDDYFLLVESGKVVVPLHEIYSPSDVVNDALNKKYDNMFKIYSFLLYFLFISKENLNKTSVNFNGVGYPAGKYEPLLGTAPEVAVAGDTGFILALELFDKKVPFQIIPRSETAYLQGEEKPVNKLIQQMKDKEGIFSNGWLHLQNTGNTIPL